MTESKMLKILVDLSEKQDYGVFYLIDVWQTDKTKRVREVIKISDLVEEFKKKEGKFYPKYKISSTFKELIKHLEKKEEMQIECYYKDTYDAYMEQWKKEHPEEKDYKTWLENEKRKQKRKYLQYVGSMGLFGSQYKNLINNNYFNF